ncbi:MAG: NAD(P)/FAD-dependent oxidoreductase [Gemmatimonadaceae bacterium]|nr:NAD(P)/FAD-dependent oxidoreductase [Caulobacter sp.]
MIESFEVDTLVIGAGVVGLACAAALARQGRRDVVVLEAERAIGTQTSSRNSEVIHAGIYYPTGSLKHTLCLEGRHLLYAYLAERGVDHRRCGKLIVATDVNENDKVEALHHQALRNDVEGMEMLTVAQARALEPDLNCTLASLSSQTGIIDSHGFMVSLRGELEDFGGVVAFNAPVTRIEARAAGGFQVTVGGPAPTLVVCARLVNAAGLGAVGLAQTLEGFSRPVPALRLAKGSYFGYAGRPAFSRLIYPAPVDGGLGVHVTLDLAGRMRFGPDVEWLPGDDPGRVDYAVDLARADSFYAAVRRYWPGLPDGALVADYAGCRAKLSGPGEPAADFRIDGPGAHGREGLVELFGIESPGLTSALSIARLVAATLA